MSIDNMEDAPGSNIRARRQEDQRIRRENYGLIKRFSECESKYAKHKIDKDYEINFQFKKAITKWGKPISYRNLGA